MNTRHSLVKPAHALLVGDIVDVGGFGYRYHSVLTSPRPDGSLRFPNQVVFDLTLFGHTAVELGNREPFGWNLHIHRDKPVRVLLKPPSSNNRQ